MRDPKFNIHVEFDIDQEDKVIRQQKDFNGLSDFLRWLTTFDEIDAVNITFKFSKDGGKGI